MTEKIRDEFISKEEKSFKYKLGKALASSLTGFLAGIIVTLIILFGLFDIVLK